MAEEGRGTPEVAEKTLKPLGDLSPAQLGVLPAGPCPGPQWVWLL